MAPFGTDVMNFKNVSPNEKGIFFVDGFTLHLGALFYASIRIFNNAGLYTEISSDRVIVSQIPVLTVQDGKGENDIDYQSIPNLIQGRWHYSDLCPVIAAYWSVESLAGDVLFDLKPIPNVAQVFYNDELLLENGMKYFVTVKTVDFLDRVKITRSNGITVRIQPPMPGLVRDGSDKDINYQFSTTEIAANWDEFGDSTNDPTQSIHHYEVAVGNDRRYSGTRSNIHFFVNVGLNTSFIFSDLNLTAKTVKYFVTVRSYSEAGSYSEGYSNGIRVGFNDEIVPGEIIVKKFQKSTTAIELSWIGFKSDIDIIEYKVAVSSHNDVIANQTVQCDRLIINQTMFDIKPLESVDLNEYVKLDGLHLQHGHAYYTTVVAEDEAGMCISSISEAILIDTSPPLLGEMYVNGLKCDTVVYLKLKSELHVQWKNVSDKESGIKEAHVFLYQCDCCIQVNSSLSLCQVIDEISVRGESKTAFYEQYLSSDKAFYVVVEFVNNAGLNISLRSSAILLDSSQPLMGEIKITNDWYYTQTYQSSTEVLFGYLPIATTWNDYICPSQITIFPSSSNTLEFKGIRDLGSEYLSINSSGVYLGIGYSSDLSDIIESGFETNPFKLNNGNYSFSLKAASGTNIISTIGLVTSILAIPLQIAGEKPHEQEFDLSLFANVSGLTASENVTEYEKNSDPEINEIHGKFVQNNESLEETAYFDSEEYGFGISLLGYKIGDNKHFHHVFWARSKFAAVQRWFEIDSSPDKEHIYIINVIQKSDYLIQTVDITIIVDDEEILNVAGFKFSGRVKVAGMVWNENDYKPPINDIYNPFHSEGIIKYVKIPDERDRPCRHGRGFYDGESSIKEIWIGVSDDISEPGNISPLVPYKHFCYPCIKPCDQLCELPCEDQRLENGFSLIPIQINDLQLKMADVNSPCNNITTESKCNNSAYYINAKLVNFAGLETFALSNAIEVDLTPPVFGFVRCLDPTYDENEPTSHIGSNSTVGAYWNFTEDLSQIEMYFIEITDKDSGAILLNKSNVGLQDKVRIDLINASFQDGRKYLFDVYATNSAGLTTNGSCLFHVNLFSPDASAVKAKALYTDNDVKQNDNNLAFAETSTKIGIEWNGGTADTEFYGILFLFSTSNVFKHTKLRN